MDCEEVAKVESALEDGSEQEPCEDGSEKGSSEHSDTPPLDASLYPLHLRVSLARARGLALTPQAPAGRWEGEVWSV